MQRWSERPPSKDPVEAMLDGCDAFLSKHASLLAKAVPPLVGFGIFLLYFYRNRFYPSFDLFQFSSLLLAAAIIGFAIVGTVIVAMFVPGAVLFHLFLNTKAIKEDIQYALPYSEEKRGSAVLQLVSLAYFGPYAACGLGLFAVVLIDSSYFLWAVFLWPIVVALTFGALLAWRFELTKAVMFDFGWVAYLAQLMFILLLISVIQNSAPVIDHLPSRVQYVLLWAIPVVLAILVGICSMAHFAGWTAAVHFSLFFGLFVAAFSGALTTLPEKAVKSLGLGAYQAEMIMLDPVFCDRDLSALGINEDCTLREVHVVWSFGESIVLRPALDEHRHVQIPALFVRSLVRSTSKGN